MKKLLKTLSTKSQTPRSEGRSTPQSARSAASDAVSASSAQQQPQQQPQVPQQIITPRMANYGAHLSPRSRDARLEAAVNGAMDYLANEGLTVMGLFKDKAAHASVHKTMVAIMSGPPPPAPGDPEPWPNVDFVALNDAPLATTVLEECLIRISEPVFPWKLVEPLAEALRQSAQEAPEKKHLRMQETLLEAVRQNAVSPIFLNLLGLLNLVVQHEADNGASLQVTADAFAPRLLENFGANMQPSSREWRYNVSKASSVLAQLIDKGYVMFPPQTDSAAAGQMDATLDAPQPQGTPPSTGPSVGLDAAPAVPPEPRAADKDSSEEARGDEMHHMRKPSQTSSAASADASWPGGDLAILGLLPEGGPDAAPVAPKSAGAAYPVNEGDAVAGSAAMAVSAAGAREVEGGEEEDEELDDDEDEDEDEGEPVDLWAIALYAYTATEEDELTFSKGARIHLTMRSSWDADSDQVSRLACFYLASCVFFFFF